MNRREELNDIIADARKELYKLDEERDMAIGKKLIGKCFRYRDNYSPPENANDYWWTYARVVSVDGSGVRVHQFDTDKYDEIAIEFNNYHNVGSFGRHNGWTSIDHAKFKSEWKKLVNRISKYSLTHD